MNQKGIESLFANSTRLKVSPSELRTLTQEELATKKSMMGVNLFKRRALGFCGYQTVISQDKFASLLHEIGVVESTDRGKEVIPHFDKLYLYHNAISGLTFREFTNAEGNSAYEITQRPFSYEQ